MVIEMKVCFLAVNAKYIHTNPAVRLLTKVTRSKYDADFKEFTIKDKVESIVSNVLDYDVIGLSCYIWNIEMMINIAKRIKEINPNIIVFAGGPEVGYDTPSFVEYFDYVMAGEGECTIIPFLDFLSEKSNDIPDGIACLTKPYAKPQYVEDLSIVPSILDMYNEDDKKHRIIYVETSRGCPFNCSYCLSSLEKGVRFFPKEYVDEIFNYIKNNDLNCVKFLDRTFNVQPNRFIELCKFLESTNNTYQFEIEPSLINDKVIEYLTKEVTPNKFRLEIGIQSLLDDAIKAVDRVQNAPKLLETIKTINEANRVTIHVDLIAGLPYENLESFKETFNKTFALLCEELQLGFLKLLRGTKLRNQQEEFEFKFTPCAPYEVIANKFVSEEEMNIIKDCETSLEWMWNHKRAYNFLLHTIKDSAIDNYFEFFANFTKHYNKKLPLEKNYEALISYLKELNLDKKEYIDDLKLDYLEKVKIRPYRFYGKEEYSQNELIEKVMELDESYTKHLLQNSFITPYYDGFIVITYNNQKANMRIIHE